ncbi:hypothetical protein HDV02_006033 [Globomyces sp. JEL0801]|nr:hypothetical protein HDV02_006033 [Globomyces sp. JEL0801]
MIEETDEFTPEVALNSPEQLPLTESVSLDIQLFPHSEVPLHRQDQNRPFLFTPVEKRVTLGNIVQIGRKIDRSKDVYRGSTREDRAAQNVSLDRNHMLYFRDVGSSSGTFLNRLRLSPSGKESRPYPVKSGDIIQLGVDYQGRQEGTKKKVNLSLEIYKAVMIKVFINAKKGTPKQANRQRLNRAVRLLLSAMNPNTTKEDENTPVDCCICISAMAPFQALFLAPCSHCFHYKCVTTLLGAGFMFQCPLCRQVANLDATVAEPDEDTDIDVDEIEDEDRNDILSDEDKPMEVEGNDTPGESSVPLDIPNSVGNRPMPPTQLDQLVSPSTPRNHSHISASLERNIESLVVQQPTQQDRTTLMPLGTSNQTQNNVPPEIFESLAKVTAALARGDTAGLDLSISEYANHLKEYFSHVSPQTPINIRDEALQRLTAALPSAENSDS